MWYAIGAAGVISSLGLILLWINRLEGTEAAKRSLLADSPQRSRFKEGRQVPGERARRRGFGRR